jgi:primase-polymerase (primpol)-like protein
MRPPPELLEYKQWVLWRKAEVNGRITKVPISPWSGKAAACDKPQTWSTYRHVVYVLRRFRCDGIGFVFTEADPFCGIDLDHCRQVNGTVAPKALEIIRRFGSYTELSPSGLGAHILIQAKLPAKGRRTERIEFYDSSRYFTMTGKHLSGTPFAIHNRQHELESLMAELFPAESSLSSAVPRNSGNLSDEDLIERARRMRAMVISSNVCGQAIHRITTTTTAAQTWHSADFLPFGVVAITNGLIGYSAVRA